MSLGVGQLHNNHALFGHGQDAFGNGQAKAGFAGS